MKLTAAITKLPKRLSIPLGVVGLLMVGVAALQFAGSTSFGGALGGQKTQTAAAYQKKLKDQVDTAQGTPAEGRDPSLQQQSSLAAVASKPAGVGTQTDKPAAGVSGNNGMAVDPGQVYAADQKASGINDAGCFYDYGTPGTQCVPAHLADDNGKLTCPNLRMHFPRGVGVSGTDRFGLDKNGDKIACGAGD